MATAYSETFVNFVGTQDAGVSTNDIERFNMVKMYERRTHHDTDKRRVPAVISNLDLSLARCRGACIVESINRFEEVDSAAVTAAVRAVHNRLNH